MPIRTWELSALSGIIFLVGCSEHLDRIAVTAPTSGTVLMLTNGSNITLREVKIRVLSVASQEEPWHIVPDLPKGASVPIDMTTVVEDAHRPDVPPGTIFDVQMIRRNLEFQLKTWKFKEERSPSGNVRLVAINESASNVKY